MLDQDQGNVLFRTLDVGGGYRSKGDSIAFNSLSTLAEMFSDSLPKGDNMFSFSSEKGWLIARALA